MPPLHTKYNEFVVGELLNMNNLECMDAITHIVLSSIPDSDGGVVWME